MVRWLGAAAGPMIAGLVMELEGARTSFMVLAAITGLATVIAFFLKETVEYN
jgi:predicted MFS family arabinose efflux permease